MDGIFHGLGSWSVCAYCLFGGGGSFLPGVFMVGLRYSTMFYQPASPKGGCWPCPFGLGQINSIPAELAIRIITMCAELVN